MKELTKGFSPRNGEVILKTKSALMEARKAGFSPRNGEVILKLENSSSHSLRTGFQSPQWGSNSKV